jgi:hypothetical protein
MKRSLLTILLLFIALPSLAQEFELFDPSDFLDPRERGAVFTPDGWSIQTIDGRAKEGDRFYAMRAYVGYVRNYQWRETPANADVNFAHLTWSRYQANHQLNLKLTLFDVDRSSQVQIPRYRATMQFARYFAIPVHQRSVDAKDEVEYGGRLLFTGAFEENAARNLAGAGSHRFFDYEGGMELDSYARVSQRFIKTHDDVSALGSFVWARRSIGDRKFADRLIYYYRGPQLPAFGHRVRLSGDIGLGAEHATGHWHGAAMFIINASAPIPHFDGNINLSFAPTYLPGRDGKHTYREIAIYIDRTLLAHIIPIH